MPRITTCTTVLIAVVFALGAASPAALAQTEENCIRHDCSNDSDVEEVYGDEAIEWDPLPEWDTRACPETPQEPCVTDDDRRCYEVAYAETLEVIHQSCDYAVWSDSDGAWSYSKPVPRFAPYATGPDRFPEYGVAYRYVVRSCEGPVCQPWEPRLADDTQDYVEFIGGAYACFGVHDGERCEDECYPGAPKRYPELPDCPLS